MTIVRRKKDVDIQSNLSRELSSQPTFGCPTSIEDVTNSGGYMQQRTSYKSSFTRVLAMLGACAALLFPAMRSDAQNINAGEIRGTIVDSSGANVPEAAVTLTNKDTGVVTHTKSDSRGIYDVPQLTPGVYSISFSVPSYKTFVQDNVLLQSAPITVNAALQVGAISEKVVVNSNAIVQLQTEDSEQNLILDAKTIDALPNVGSGAEGWFNETALIPGVNGGGGQTTNGSGIGINGGESYQESFLLNGGTATLIGSQNPDWIINPTDFIAENDFDTHTFNASSGNGQAVFNVITKSGTNHFHGSVYDYNQNAHFGARNYFSDPTQPIAPFSSNVIGATIGGPIKRDKLFFFFGFQRYVYTAGSPGFAVVPTTAERAGDFSQQLATDCPTGFANDPTTAAAICNPDPALGAAYAGPYDDPGQIFNPATTTRVGGQAVRQPFLDNMLPAADLNQQALNIQKFFPAPNVNHNGANLEFSNQTSQVTYWYNGKVDYNLSKSHHINASATYGTISFPSVTPYTPIGEYTEEGNEWAPQISDTWTISPTSINEVRFSMIRFSGNWVGGDFDKNYPTQIGIPNPTSNVFPGINIANISGFSTGLDAVLHEDDFVPSDVFTLVRGKHIIKFGGEFDIYEVNINFGGESDGNFSFSGISTLDPRPASPTNPLPSVGIGYADLLLGNVSNYSDSISPLTGSRLKSTELFFQDDYKASPNLTFNLGLRYEIEGGWKEAHNELSDFDPNLVNPETGTLGALWFAGNDGRTSVEATQYGLWQPRVGFAWSPRKNLAVRGGFGLYDELFGYNTYAGSTGTGLTQQVSVNTTDGLTPAFNLAQGPPPLIVPSPATLTPSLLNGQGIGYIPYHTKTPYIEQYQLDVQYELPRGIVLDAAYVGSKGQHNALAADFNQIPANLISNFTNPGVNMAVYRPYPQYQGIGTTLGGGTSHYDSLQMRAQKQYTQGLQFIANFTYSHTLDDGTGSGYGGAGADGSLWQNGYSPRSSYGNSQLDVPFTFNGDVIYELPFGKGKVFLNRGGILNGIIGGWVVSGLFQIHSGTPFTPSMDTNLSGSLAGSWFPNRIGSGRLAHPTIAKWFDPSAFVQPADGTYGDSGRDILFGPSWRQLDVSLSKHWAVRKFGQLADISARVDASDVFNTPNFSNPNAVIGSPTVGTISGANTSRAMQFNGKFTF
jgi:hypothetical protein